MSDECGNKGCPPTPPTPSYCPTGCYWFSQGQCFLNILPECEVFAIICRSPKAAEDVVRCVELGCCQAPSARVLEYAENEIRCKPEDELLEEFQRRVNLPYRDLTPYIGPGVFKTPPDSE